MLQMLLLDKASDAPRFFQRWVGTDSLRHRRSDARPLIESSPCYVLCLRWRQHAPVLELDLSLQMASSAYTKTHARPWHPRKNRCRPEARLPDEPKTVGEFMEQVVNLTRPWVKPSAPPQGSASCEAGCLPGLGTRFAYGKATASMRESMSTTKGRDY